jgi:hypothetical protein
LKGETAQPFGVVQSRPILRHHRCPTHPPGS